MISSGKPVEEPKEGTVLVKRADLSVASATPEEEWVMVERVQKIQVNKNYQGSPRGNVPSIKGFKKRRPFFPMSTLRE